jgi:putative ABC transport system substrate-binding protein
MHNTTPYRQCGKVQSSVWGGSVRRRDFIKLAGGAATVWPLAASAQQPSRALRRLGVVSLGLQNEPFFKSTNAVFLQALAALGWKEGSNLQIDWRWHGADAALAERQAAELIALKPDVLFAVGNPAVEKIKQQTRTIPVVFTLVSDPVGMGYVDSLARPGGNITGFMTNDPPIYTKQLQMLAEINPPATTVAVLYNPETAPYAGHMVQAMEEAAKSIGITVRNAPCHNDAEIEAVMTSLPQGGGLLTIAEVFNQLHGQVIGNLALKYKIPTIVFTPQMIASGGLISYTTDFLDLFSRSASYVDRILKGEKPADLPVQAPTKFKLTISLKTANALGVTVAPALLNNADEVIE